MSARTAGRAVRALAAVVALLGVPTAQAQSFSLYGVTPRSIGLGGAQGASQGDYAATFYNPALLDRGDVGFSFHWQKPFLSVAKLDPSSPQELNAVLPPDFAGWSVGFAAPLFGLLKDKATVGLAVYIPHRQVFRTRMIDESTPYFLRYDNAPARIQIAAGFSARPWRWVSIGAGAQVMSDYGGEAVFTARLPSAGTGVVLRRNLSSEVAGVAAPTVGLALGPWAGVRGFLVWRGELKAIYALPITVDLEDFGALDVMVNGVSHYAPHALSGGASVRLWDEKLLLTADVTWEHWSAVPPLVADIDIHLAGTLALVTPTPDVSSRDIAMDFSDTVTARLAGELFVHPRVPLRLAYGLRMTPTPPQTGRTNFLDTTTHLLSLGSGYVFDDPLQMAKGLALEASAQLAILPGQDVVKSGPNNNPDYRFGGAVLALAVGARYQF